MSTTYSTTNQVINRFDNASNEVQTFFTYLPSLVTDQYPWDICLAYLFSKLEMAHHTSLYCGMTKLHRVNSEIAWIALQNEYMTRDSFKILYKNVFEVDLPEGVYNVLDKALRIRDKVMHGKKVAIIDKRDAVGLVIDYADDFNQILFKLIKVRPFGGELRGFAGSMKKYDKKTSRLLIKGLGFKIS